MHCIVLQKMTQEMDAMIVSALPDRLISIPAKDHIPKNCNVSDILQAQNRKQCDKLGLAVLLKFKANARIMITTNIDLSNRLINGQIANDLIARNNKWVPIKRKEASVYINKYKITSPAINRTQFPLILSWVIHSSEIARFKF